MVWSSQISLQRWMRSSGSLNARLLIRFSDVARQLAEEEDGLYILHCGWLQDGEVVPHDGGPVAAAPLVVQRRPASYAEVATNPVRTWLASCCRLRVKLESPV